MQDKAQGAALYKTGRACGYGRIYLKAYKRG